MTPTVEIKHLPDGTPYCRPYLGTDPVTGKPRRPFRSFPNARDDAEAQAMAERWMEELISVARLGSQARLRDLLASYVQAIEDSDAPSNTVNTYRNLARHVGHLGVYPAQEITPYQLSRLNGELKEKGLSNRTRRVFFWFLSGFYHWLGETTGMQVNPVAGVKMAREPDAEAEAWEGEEIARLLDALDRLRECPYKLRRATAMAATIALYTGTRVGEALGLQWRDLSTRDETIRVRGTVVLDAKGRPKRQSYTKSKRSRTFYVAPEFWPRLKAWRDAQRERGITTGAKSPVVTTGHLWMRPGDVSKTFRGIVAGIGLEGPFHQLRHTHATVLLSQGIDPRVVQERLGHAVIATTLALYSHVLPARDFQAASAFADALSTYREYL